MDDVPPQHVRHQPPTTLARPRPCWIACPQFRSNVNLSRLVRLAGSCGISQILAAGTNKIDREIARDAMDYVTVERRRSLGPRLQELRASGFRLIGLEQTDRSQSIYNFQFPHSMVLVLGHERDGMDEPLLQQMDDVVSLPVYGMPYSYNVVTAATMALYEYCKQFPLG